MTTPWVVRQIQSDWQTNDHRRSPSVDPATEFVSIFTEVLIESCGAGAERANGFVSLVPV